MQPYKTFEVKTQVAQYTKLYLFFIELEMLKKESLVLVKHLIMQSLVVSYVILSHELCFINKWNFVIEFLYWALKTKIS